MFKAVISQPLLQGLPDLTPLLVLNARLIDAVIFAIVQAVSFVYISTVVALLRDCITALSHVWLLLPGFAFAGRTRLTASAPDGAQPA